MVTEHRKKRKQEEEKIFYCKGTGQLKRQDTTNIPFHRVLDITFGELNEMKRTRTLKVHRD